MFDFHKDRKWYFDMQVQNSTEYVIPFINTMFPVKEGHRVLEIGCGEGGVLKAFIDKGCYGVGVELAEGRLKDARIFMKDELEQNKVLFISKDIYKVNPQEEFGAMFDIIILKDVIEHIHDQKKLITWMKTFLNPNGVIFFGFPPWQMPFGGHQQICNGKLMSKLPYYHLLPMPVYKWLLKKTGENVDELAEIKETGISIEKFERIVRKTGYRVVDKTHYLINPIYRFKFNIKPLKQFPILKSLPYIRNFYTTCVYYLIQQ